MINLIIIAAGNGKRMGNINVPKVLYPVNGVPNLKRIITNAIESEVFDSIDLVIKDSAVKSFKEFLDNSEFDIKINLIPINSGLGDGHAILSMYKNAHQYNNSILVWGDVYIDSPMIFKELKDVGSSTGNNFSSAVIPVCTEKNPYVTILTDSNMNALSADFSKLGETHLEGFHDQSIFYINNDVIYDSLQKMHEVLWKNGQYITQSKELNFLHILHYLRNINYPANCYITEYPTKSFNSIEELTKLENSL
jgi:bifunctional N-acetylglucosamine-1-phosphate-uridyltransferase/glucosamine-1-phosphate-acetyltransferase GlmU-like protein